MISKKTLVLYFTIAIIFLISIIILNSTQDKDRWVKKLSPSEQKLYILEKEALLESNDLNMTKADLYYSEREKYCHSFKETSEINLCHKRTLPWWDNQYKIKSNPSHY